MGMINKILLSAIFILSFIKTNNIGEWNEEKTDFAKLMFKETMKEFLQTQVKTKIISEDIKEKIENDIDNNLKELVIPAKKTLDEVTADFYSKATNAIENNDTEKKELQKNMKALNEGEKLIDLMKLDFKEILNKDSKENFEDTEVAEAAVEVPDQEITS